MAVEKKPLSFEELEAQTALELPDREMMLVTIVIADVLNNIHIPITVQNNKVAVQVCAVVEVLADQLGFPDLTCTVQQ